jgi:segregation and condensation protein A
MSFEIKLHQFEGPFDLLLFFIERDELDIYDIPIATITNDFLDYIHQLNELNMEVASEFILVAATLMRIKAKLLLPRKELDEAGNEIDPREDLVARLIEYKKYKAILASMAELEGEQLLREKRGNVLHELEAIQKETGAEQELLSVDLYQLMKAFSKVLTRFDERESAPKHIVVRHPYSIEAQRNYLLESLHGKKKVSFSDVFTGFPDKMKAIYTFLALLELLQLQQIDIKMGEGYNNFYLLPKTEAA